MSDLVGRIGPAHPDWPGRAIDRMTEGEAHLRNRIREAIEELEAAGHNGCAEIVRARVWHG
jgi:phage-related baseplate assembly protein